MRNFPAVEAEWERRVAAQAQRDDITALTNALLMYAPAVWTMARRLGVLPRENSELLRFIHWLGTVDNAPAPAAPDVRRYTIPTDVFRQNNQAQDLLIFEEGREDVPLR